MTQLDPYAALRRPAFRRFLGGSMLANLSSQTLLISAAWYLYERTGSAWALATLALMNYLPIFAFSLPAGWAADHIPRRKVMAFAVSLQAVAALALLALALTDGPDWPWFPLIFLAATGRAFLTPSAVSYYPQLMEEHELPRAVSWSSANFQAGAIAGPIIGGLLLHRWGLAPALAFACAGPLLYLALLPGMHAFRQKAASVAEPLREKILGGFAFVGKDKAILGALSLDFVAVLFGGVEGIMPIFAKDILGVGPDGLGLLKAAPFIGALLMSFVLAHRRPMQRPGRDMLLCVAGFGLCMLAFGLSTHFLLSVGALVAAGMLDQVSVLVRQTLVQVRTPDALRGRVQAVNFLFIGSSNELGEFESATTAGFWGPVGSVMVGGTAVLVLVAVWALGFPALRQLPPLDAKAT